MPNGSRTLTFGDRQQTIATIVVNDEISVQEEAIHPTALNYAPCMLPEMVLRSTERSCWTQPVKILCRHLKFGHRALVPLPTGSTNPTHGWRCWKSSGNGNKTATA